MLHDRKALRIVQWVPIDSQRIRKAVHHQDRALHSSIEAFPLPGSRHKQTVASSPQYPGNRTKQ
jgi:hypothetical protein